MKSKLHAGEQAYDKTDYLKEAPHQKKSFHSKDLKKVVPLTENQEAFFQVWYDGDRNGYTNDVLIGHGVAGSGKSLLACYMALQLVLDENTDYEKIVIIRSVVPSRDMGFLKGSEEEKSDVFKMPYRQLFDKLFPWSKSFDNMCLMGLAQFETTSHLRGTTFENCIVVFDEFQNATEVEMETVLTRLGKNARMICIGDTMQNDLGSKSGISKIVPVLKRTDGTTFIEFGLEDIVRSGWVKSYLIAKHKLLQKNA